MALPLPVYLLFLVTSYNPYSEEAWATGRWTFGAKPVEVINVRSARDDGNWHIIRFDYTQSPEAAPPGEGACQRRAFSDPDIHIIPDISEAAEWWPANTMRLALINNDWPLYTCTSGNSPAYSLAIIPGGNRVFMWRYEPEK